MTPGPSCFGSPCRAVWGWLRGQRTGTDPDCLCLGTALRVWPPPRSSPPQTWARAGLWLVRQDDVIRGRLWDVLWLSGTNWCLSMMGLCYGCVLSVFINSPKGVWMRVRVKGRFSCDDGLTGVKALHPQRQPRLGDGDELQGDVELAPPKMPQPGGSAKLCDLTPHRNKGKQVRNTIFLS